MSFAAMHLTRASDATTTRPSSRAFARLTPRATCDS
jgi:hypothetical protein